MSHSTAENGRGWRGRKPLPILKTKDWIGVDFDGTLVKYDGWKGCDHHGEPITAMVNRVRFWLSKGISVRIFTARVGPVYPDQCEPNARTIQKFCIEQFGQPLPITHEKDQLMIELWDDKAVNPNCPICPESKLS